MTYEEMKARTELASLYRIFNYLGWTELIYNHITLRIPGPEKHILINPFGLSYSEVTAENLVKIDLDGNIIGESFWKYNVAGYTTHSVLHKNVPDAVCVMHTHTTAGIAVACLEQGLSYSNFYSAQLYNKVAYHNFEGITIYEDEGSRLIESIAGKPAIILRNHGLMGWGSTAAKAFSTLWILNRACEIQCQSLAMGKALEISEEVLKKCTADSFHFNPSYGEGQDVLDALTRIINKLDPSYQSYGRID